MYMGCISVSDTAMSECGMLPDSADSQAIEAN